MRDDAGFFVPDEVVDAIPHITLPGLHLYLLLGRSRTLGGYPTLDSLAREMGKKKVDVWKFVGLLYERKFINDADVEQLMEAAETDDEGVDS